MRTHRFSVILALGLVLAVGFACRRDLQARRSQVQALQATEAGLSAGPRFQSTDLYALKAVGDVEVSPDGTRIAYSVQNSDRPGRPYSQVWIMEIATGKSLRLGSERQAASNPRWSCDGQRIAYFGREEGGAGVVVAARDGSGTTFLAPVVGTNHSLPSSGERLAWSPDGKQIAFISASPGPETENANGDPMVITRYLYKPTATEGLTRFDDNRRLHVFIVDVGTKQVRQLTSGNYYEHSIDWSPRGDELLFISNHEADFDRVFNYDIFVVKVTDGTIRRLTDTKSAEYRPVWSPDGQAIAYQATTRTLTSSESTMEDTHIWLVDAMGKNRRELGGGIDNRQGPPRWAPDGRAVYFTVQERGSVHLYRLTVPGGRPEPVALAADQRGSIGSFSIAAGDLLAYTMTTPSAPAELYVKQGGTPAKALTSVNKDLLAAKKVADVESLPFRSVDGMAVEAFLTKPPDVTGSSKHAMIVLLKGGPFSQDGPNFNRKAQVYAAHGFAVLQVNYRGSIGYGQKFADAIFKDENGHEAQDVLAAVDAALATYGWIDPNRLGIEGVSYGGQLTNWLITQTARFRAAIPTAGISNLITFDYMAYYHDSKPVKFGGFPHEPWRTNDMTAPRTVADFMWERSPLRYVAKVKTPTMFIHGENDNDVPIAEAEQYYIALKDVGVETVMVRYPREGHGLRETKHVVDSIDRSIQWYDRHFAGRSTSPSAHQ
jgi:dipeptidyl aminopeptidase/acylaminoacyl peptidase